MATPPRQRAQQYLASRKKAFARVFLGTGVDGKVVLEDLAKFGRAHDTTFHTDERASLILQGRHEMWLRIQQHLQLSDDQLWALYGNPTLTNISEPRSED